MTELHVRYITKKQLTFGDFCFLPATLCPFPEKVASQTPHKGKIIKWATKRAVKKDDKRKKRILGKYIENRCLPRPPKPKKDKICLEMLERQKKLLNYILPAEKYALSVKNLFFSHSHVNQPKTAPKRRIWSKMLFFCY